jgi:hypothetical protein
MVAVRCCRGIAFFGEIGPVERETCLLCIPFDGFGVTESLLQFYTDATLSRR